MHGPGLMALFADLLTGGSGSTRVLKPTIQGNAVTVSAAERASAAQQLLGK
jgi:hypothetical protein